MCGIHLFKISLVAQLVKNLPAMQETWVQFLGSDDPLKKEMATHSSILAWRNPMYRGAWQATVHEVARVRHSGLAIKPPPYICLNEITTKYWLFWLMLLRMIFTCFILTNSEYF